jgi:hypothetical protein
MNGGTVKENGDGTVVVRTTQDNFFSGITIYNKLSGLSPRVNYTTKRPPLVGEVNAYSLQQTQRP